jgi:hypothetical protein
VEPGFGGQVLPGEMIVLGDSEGMECTREEADLMEVAAQVNAQVRALGLPSKSIVHSWKTAGVGGIPGYVTHYDRLATGGRYARNVGYLGITLDASMSALKINEACTTGSERECQVVAYQEGGKFAGSLAGGGIGAAASAAACTVFAVTTAGIGGVACAVIAGGLGAAAGGYAGGVGGRALHRVCDSYVSVFLFRLVSRSVRLAR